MSLYYDDHLYTDETGLEYPFYCDLPPSHVGPCDSPERPRPLPRPVRQQRIDMLGCTVVITIIIASLYMLAQGVRLLLS